jgi:hypothetical protein
MKKLLFIVALPLVLTGFAWAQFNINATGTTYTQNFDTLTPAGTWADNSTLTGWYARTTATASITAFGLNTGSTTTAGLYSFGSTGNNDRAFGFAPSNAYTGAAGIGKGFIGWRLKNNTGSVISSLTVTWTGEQWRKENNAAAHTLELYYQTGSTVTDLLTGTWTSASSVFTSPITGATTATALDGNLAANRVSGIVATLSGLNLSVNGEIMLRWEDLNDSGNDHFLAIDDVSIIASAASVPSITVSTGTLTGFSYVFNNGPSSEQSFTISGSNLTANISIAATTNYEISTGTGGSFVATNPIILTQSGGSVGNTTIYVRLKANLAVENYNNEDITSSSTGATPQSVTCSGSVTAPPPPSAPTATAATSTANTSFTANWDAVSGATGYELDVYYLTTVTNATDLIISEYVEGSSNNKYIEIYNGTGSSVDLSGYKLELFPNGAATASPSNTLSGTLAHGSAIVYQNSAAALTLPDGVTATTNSAVNFNGDDAVALYKISTSSYVDIFGVIGNDPGTAWTGDGGYTTVDRTLVRNSSVTGGITTNPSGTGTTAFTTLTTEWTMHGIDTATYLGSHTMAGGSTLVYVSGYQDYDAGNATSLNVTGLTAGTTYYYVVRAYNTYGTSDDSNEIEVTTTNTTPTITVSTATLSGFGYMEGSGPSAEQSFTVSGSNLTANISLDAPTNYQISTGTGANFNANMADPLVLSQSGGTVGTTTIYVRLKAGLAAGDYNGEVITASSTGADNKTVTCSGTVTPIPDPEITVSATTLSGFSYKVGSGPSAEQSFTVSGTYLTANISIAAATNYEISTETGGSFTATNPITLTQSGGTVGSTTIYVRLKASLAEGAYNGELITITSTDAETKTVILNGYVQTSDVPFLYWDFNDGAPSSGNWTQPIAANVGSGSLTYTFANAVAFNGTTLNTMAGDVVSGSSFVPQNGTDNVNNGEEFVMTVNTTDLENITLTYATQRTSTGFTDQSIWYSLDGGQNYTLFTTFTSIASSWEVKEVDFSSVTGANGNPNFMVKIVLDGASGTQGTGNNRFDNISFFGDEEDVNPVELASFTATISAQNYITLTWVTQTETGMRGYYIYRDTDSNFAGAQIVSPLIPSANSSQMQTYMFEDTKVFETGTYFYWLQTNDMDGTVGFHGPVSVFFNALGDNPTPEIPLVTELKSVYPNPFNPVVFIPFSLAKDSNVSFKIYDARGQIVKHFELGSKAAGNYRITWDGTDYNGAALSNGVYQIVMSAGSQVYQTKTTLLK